MTPKQLNQIVNGMVKHLQRGGNIVFARLYATNKGVTPMQCEKMAEIALFELKN